MRQPPSRSWAPRPRPSSSTSTAAVSGPGKDRPFVKRGKPADKTIVQSANTSLYLNVGSDSTSYKTLTFGTAASTSAWALEGDTIITAQSSTWGRREFSLSCRISDTEPRWSFHTAAKTYTDKVFPVCLIELNFLACKLDSNYWQVYLQTGSATPSGGTCSNYQSLHLPCLC